MQSKHVNRYSKLKFRLKKTINARFLQPYLLAIIEVLATLIGCEIL